jgi:hypothetical protein
MRKYNPVCTAYAPPSYYNDSTMLEVFDKLKIRLFIVSDINAKIKLDYGEHIIHNINLPFNNAEELEKLILEDYKYDQSVKFSHWLKCKKSKQAAFAINRRLMDDELHKFILKKLGMMLKYYDIVINNVTIIAHSNDVGMLLLMLPWLV